MNVNFYNKQEILEVLPTISMTVKMVGGFLAELDKELAEQGQFIEKIFLEAIEAQRKHVLEWRDRSHQLVTEIQESNNLPEIHQLIINLAKEMSDSTLTNESLGQKITELKNAMVEGAPQIQ